MVFAKQPAPFFILTIEFNSPSIYRQLPATPPKAGWAAEQCLEEVSCLISSAKGYAHRWAGLIMLSHLRFELGGFFKWHWPHFLLAAPGALLCTILHEGAHALAVTLQGGQVTKFVWLPSMERWGYIQYQFPDHYHYSTFVIAVAPYCLWLLLMLMAGVLSLKTNPHRPWASSTIFIWMFVVPLGDIANAAIPYLLGSLNDFTDAFGYPTGSEWALIVLFSIASAAFGMIIQQRLYRERALSVPGYTLMAMAGLALIGALHIAKVHLT